MSSRLINSMIGKIVVCYIIITYIVYLILPIPSLHLSNQKECYTVIFLLFTCISFYLGTKSVPIDINKSFITKSTFNIKQTTLTILLLALIVIILLYLKDLAAGGVAHISFSMGENYAAMIEAELSKNTRWGQIYNLVSPLRIILISYSILNYKEISFFNRCLLLLMIFSYLLISISKGQFVGIGNSIILIIIPLFFKCWRENKLKQFRNYIFIFVSVFAFLFILNQFARSESLGGDISVGISEDNYIYSIFGEKMGAGIIRLMMYFSHGYKGLNYSLQLPFEWTYGYGGSRALGEYFHQYLGLPSNFERTYPLRVEAVFGYDCQMSWPTAFSWWASDLSFPGVIFIMYILGRLYCKVVRDACYKSSVFAVAFLSELTILLLFLPMNNQAFQSRESLIITVCLFLLWLYRR